MDAGQLRRLAGLDQLRPYAALAEKPSVVGRLFAALAVGVTLVWGVTVFLLLFGSSPRAVLRILTGGQSSVLPVWVSIGVRIGIYLAAVLVLALLAAGSAFLTTRFWWRLLVTRVDQLTYPRSVAVGVAVGLTSHYVLGVALTVLASGGLVVGYVLGVTHLGVPGVDLVVGGVALAVLGFVAWTFLIAIGIMSVTFGIPLVLPTVVSIWLTWRSRRDSPDNPPPPAA